MKLRNLPLIAITLIAGHIHLTYSMEETSNQQALKTMTINPGLTVVATVNMHDTLGPVLQFMNLSAVQGLENASVSWYVPTTAQSVKDIVVQGGTGAITIPQYCLSSILGPLANSDAIKNSPLASFCLKNAQLTPLHSDAGMGVQLQADAAQLFSQNMKVQLQVAPAAQGQHEVVFSGTSISPQGMHFATINPSLATLDTQLAPLMNLQGFDVVVATSEVNQDPTGTGFASTPAGFTVIFKAQLANSGLAATLGKILAVFGFAQPVTGGAGYTIAARANLSKPQQPGSKISYGLELLQTGSTGKVCMNTIVQQLGSLIPQLPQGGLFQQLSQNLSALCVENMQLMQDPFADKLTLLVTGTADIAGQLQLPILFNIKLEK